MGQKVHPIGFRVGITKQHESQWFANFQKYQYAQSVVEDRFLRATIKKLFLDLLNPAKKARTSTAQTKIRTPKITQIKIERSLLPYKIGIHIYAEKSLRSYIKKALSQLNLDPITAGHLQKVRQYLLNLRSKQDQTMLLSPEVKGSALGMSSSPSGKGPATHKTAPGSGGAPSGSENGRSTGRLAKTAAVKRFATKPFGQRSKGRNSLNNKGMKQQSDAKHKAGNAFGMVPGNRRGSISSSSTNLNQKFQQRLRKRQAIRQKLREQMRLLSGRKLLISNSRYLMSISSIRKNFDKASINTALLRPMKMGQNASSFGRTSMFEERNVGKSVNSKLLSKSQKYSILAPKETSSPSGASFPQGGRGGHGQLGSSFGHAKQVLRGRSQTRSPHAKGALTSAANFRSSKTGAARLMTKSAANLLTTKLTKKRRTSVHQKFVNTFFKRLNNVFLKTIRKSFLTFDQRLKKHKENQIQKYGSLRYAPLGYNKNYFQFTISSTIGARRAKQIKKQPINKLIALINSLHLKSQQKLQDLRKEFIAFGTISNSKSFGYYQIVKLISSLKDLVVKLKQTQRIKTKNKLNVGRPVGEGLTSNPTGASTVWADGAAGGFTGWAGASVAGPSDMPNKPPKHNAVGSASLKAQRDQVAGLSSSSSSPLTSTSLVKSKKSLLIGRQIKKVRKKIGLANLKGLDLLEKSRVNRLKNVENSVRKLKLSEYLKQLVIKHRQNNIYYYLGTISESSKNLKKIKQFTQKYANFLFDNLAGHPYPYALFLDKNKQKDMHVNLNQASRGAAGVSLGSGAAGISAEGVEKSTHRGDLGELTQNISVTLANIAKKTRSEKKLNEVFIDQIEKQKARFKNNILLTPKIAISFYSINAKQIESKASFVADSIVDQLEKRKAFRKVIKDAKEDLMNRLGVKGVKIQVAGRLNGAEIARTEWVRAGRVPLQTLRANIDYSYKTANTIYGIIGVKVWIFKGLSDSKL